MGCQSVPQPNSIFAKLIKIFTPLRYRMPERSAAKFYLCKIDIGREATIASRREERNAAYAQIDAEGRESEWVTHCVPCCDFAALVIYRCTEGI